MLLESIKTIEVVAAVIIREGEILCVQRSEKEKGYISLKWEFPGGKVKVGEGLEEALVREIREELSVDIEVSECLMTVQYTYPDFHLIMHVFTCILRSGEIILNEHVDAKWLPVDELDKLDWAEADVLICNSLNSNIFRK